MPDVVSVVGPTVVWLLVFFCSGIQLYYLVESLYLFCLLLVSRFVFTRR